MKFKNDKERIAFLEDHENEENGWYLWKHDDDLARYWFRFDLDDCALIVEKQAQTIHWPKEHVAGCVMHWYIVDDWHKLFADCVASRTMALAKLKEREKKQ